MLLRCQCRTLLSRPPLNPTPYIKYYSPAYRGRAIDPFAATSPSPSKKKRPYLGPDAEAQEFDDEDTDATKYFEEAKEIVQSIKKPEAEPEPFNESRDPEEEERPERRQKRGLESVDRKLSNKDLGLYSGPRKRKRDFIRWMVTSGSKHEFFPQSIAMDLESRRVERMRKRAEERMFQQMNNFFNSLSEEEIKQGKLIVPTNTVAGKRKERPVYPHPSPFQQMVGPLPPMWPDTKELESVVLKLLKRHNRALHTQYREYINWSDYKLQKQNLYFKFPNDTRSSGFSDVVSRLLAIEESGLEERALKHDENKADGKPEQREEDVKIPSPEAVDELLQMEAENSDPAKVDRESPVGKSPVWQSTSEAKSEKESAKLAEKKRENADLAYYLGRPLPLYTQFPTIPEYKHHYVNPTKEPTPFLMNPTFKPWRPIPHSTRLKMFDAWRAGLGLRNVSWLGGVSWRRVDGIIGILKKEWEFVEKVLLASLPRSEKSFCDE